VDKEKPPPYLGPLLEVIKRDPDRDKENHYFDIVSVHSYTATAESFAEPDDHEDILTQRRDDQTDLDLGEATSSRTDDLKEPLPRPVHGPPSINRRRTVIQAMALSIAAGMNGTPSTRPSTRSRERYRAVGLVRNDHTTKPSYVAFQVGATYFANVKIRGVLLAGR